MGTPKIGFFEGKCGRCGKVFIVKRLAPDFIVCDCYRLCPLCGAEMTPFTPNIDPVTYRSEDRFSVKGQAVEKAEWNLRTLFACYNHSPPYYSTQKPMEVLLS